MDGNGELDSASAGHGGQVTEVTMDEKQRRGAASSAAGRGDEQLQDLLGLGARSPGVVAAVEGLRRAINVIARRDT